MCLCEAYVQKIPSGFMCDSIFFLIYILGELQLWHI